MVLYAAVKLSVCISRPLCREGVITRRLEKLQLRFGFEEYGQIVILDILANMARPSKRNNLQVRSHFGKPFETTESSGMLSMKQSTNCMPMNLAYICEYGAQRYQRIK